MTSASFTWNLALAQSSSYGELQAAYIYNFAKYIKWPGEHTPFIIGVYGESDLTRDLKNILKSKKVWGAEIEVRELGLDAEVPACQIIFIPLSYSKSISAVREKIRTPDILIVTEEDLIKRGATISFIIEDNRLRFKLNTKELKRAGLTASEGLLKLAILSQ